MSYNQLVEENRILEHKLDEAERDFKEIKDLLEEVQRSNFIDGELTDEDWEKVSRAVEICKGYETEGLENHL